MRKRPLTYKKRFIILLIAAAYGLFAFGLAGMWDYQDQHQMEATR